MNMKLNTLLGIALLLGGFFWPASGQAQRRTPDEYAEVFAQLDSLMMTFQKAGQFREPGSTTNSRVIMDQYQALFMPDVYVWDNYCPTRDADNFNKPVKPYTGAYKLVSEFINDTYRYCDKGVRSSLTYTNADFSDIDRNEVRYIIRRETNIEAYDGSRFKSNELFQLTIKRDPSTERFKIYEMKDIDHTLDCSNCDYEAVVPVHPSEDSKINAKAWAGIEGGFGFGQFQVQDIDLSQLNPASFDQLSTSRSRIGANLESEVRSAFFVKGSVEMMFGYRNQIGASIGVAFGGFNARATYDSVVVSFRSVDPFGTSYNRVVRLSEMQEDYSITTLSVPVLFRYTRRINDRLRLHLGAGPQVFVSVKSKTTSSAVADFEARYQYDSETEQFGYVQDGGNQGYALEWTEIATEAQYSDADREWRRRSSNGYDLGNNQAVEGSATHTFGISLGWAATLAGSFKINSGNEIIAGIDVWYATLQRDAENVSFMNQTADPLGSRLSGMQDATFLNYYLKVGLRTFLWGGKKSGK